MGVPEGHEPEIEDDSTSDQESLKKTNIHDSQDAVFKEKLIIFEAKKAQILQTCYKRAPVLDGLIRDHQLTLDKIRFLQEEKSMMPTANVNNVDEMMKEGTKRLIQLEDSDNRYQDRKRDALISYQPGGPGFHPHSASFFKKRTPAATPIPPTSTPGTGTGSNGVGAQQAKPKKRRNNRRSKKNKNQAGVAGPAATSQLSCTTTAAFVSNQQQPSSSGQQPPTSVANPPSQSAHGNVPMEGGSAAGPSVSHIPLTPKKSRKRKNKSLAASGSEQNSLNESTGGNITPGTSHPPSKKKKIEGQNSEASC